MNKKLARRTIIESRRQGMSNQEIYNNLKVQFPNKKTLARLITGTATDERLKKYRWIVVLIALGVLIEGGLVTYIWVEMPSLVRTTYSFFWQIATVSILTGMAYICGHIIFIKKAEISEIQSLLLFLPSFIMFAGNSFLVNTTTHVFVTHRYVVPMTGRVLMLITMAITWILVLVCARKLFPEYHRLTKRPDGEYTL